MSANYYHGPRWTGIWDNPNTYGSLMAAGLVLAAGLVPVAGMVQGKHGSWFRYILLGFAGVMGAGLVFSYSRGSWLGAAVALLGRPWGRGRLKWRLVAPAIAVAAAVCSFLWAKTPDSASWYVRRADLGRPSAQHRAAAWRAGLKMMADHPLGVGWNKTIEVYQKAYSPPDGGADAIATNDYIMIGTELGIPALLFFSGYVALCLRRGEAVNDALGKTRAACRSSVIALVTAFAFDGGADGGLFKLPTAAIFWILLELGAEPCRYEGPGPVIGQIRTSSP